MQEVPIRKLSFLFEDRLALFQEGSKPFLAVLGLAYGRTALCFHLQSLLKDLLEETERRAIVDTLQKSGNSRAPTAKILGIHRTGLY